MHRGVSNRSVSSVHSVLASIVMAIILAVLGNAVLSQEVKEEQPKKPRFEKTNMTLTDNKSGLMWSLNAYPAERQFTWFGAFEGIDRVINKERYAGFRDWRVPSKEELESLVDLVQGERHDVRTPGRDLSAGLASVGIQNLRDEAYWSSSENRFFAAEAWVVDMTEGKASVADKTLYFNLWPVRTAR